VLDPSWDGEALVGAEGDRFPVLKVNEQLSFKDQEEFVGVVVVVPVEIALDDPETYDGVVDRRKGLVEPRLMHRRLCVDVDQGEMAKLVVEVNVVAVVGGHGRWLLSGSGSVGGGRLKRSYFEAAMRAISRIVRATQRAVDDPMVAYVDVVAALESLSGGKSAPAPIWERLDGRKRQLIDEALKCTDADQSERVRQAVMEAERLGAKSRFVAFVMDNVSLEYFRTEATGAVRPIRGADLERAVRLAYDIRSRNVHVLEDLPPEAWVLGDGAETVSPPGMGTMLSHEGLARLARHVVRSYVHSAPLGVDATFNWRASLPGQVRMPLAPQYWIWNAQGFDRNSVGPYFSGFVAHLTDTFAGRNDGVPDIRAVLERVEQLVPGTGGPQRTLMLAIYTLWHSAVAPSDQRPNAASLVAKHQRLLQQVDLPSFVVGLLVDSLPTWTEDQCSALATKRRAERSTRRHLELPAGFDAALQVMAAERLIEVGRIDEAQTLARFAVEEMPGSEPLIAWESGLGTEHASDPDLRALALGLSPGTEPQEDSPAPQAC
jgi:hypothetical protein